MTTPVTKATAIKAEPKTQDKPKRKRRIRLEKTALIHLLSIKEPQPSINVGEVVIMIKDEKKS